MVVASQGQTAVLQALPQPPAPRRRPRFAGARAQHLLHQQPLHPPRDAAGSGLRGTAVVAGLVPARLVGVAVARAGAAPAPRRQQQQLQLTHRLHLRRRPVCPRASAAGLAAGLLRGPHGAVHRTADAAAGVRWVLPPARVLAGGAVRPLPVAVVPNIPAAAREPRTRVTDGGMDAPTQRRRVATELRVRVRQGGGRVDDVCRRWRARRTAFVMRISRRQRGG
jgi:hypothetical protein